MSGAAWCTLHHLDVTPAYTFGRAGASLHHLRSLEPACTFWGASLHLLESGASLHLLGSLVLACTT